MKRLVTGIALVLAGVSAAATAIEAQVRQNWPWDARVLIDVTMPEGTNDVQLVASFDYEDRHVTQELTQGTALTGGPIFCRTGGTYHYVWDPSASGYTNAIRSLTVSASAVSPEERAWLVVDLATGETQYYALDAAPVNADGLPWRDDVYMTAKMVFRRIPAGTFTCGYTPEQIKFVQGLPSAGTASMLTAHEVELTSDYYIAIYQTTKAQAYRIRDPASTYNGDLSGFHGDNSVAAGFVCFQRGSNSVEGVNWPATKFRVTPNSFVGRLRARCGNRLMFDLPTSAQWQRAARPDSRWIWYETPEYGGGQPGDSEVMVSNIIQTISQCQRVGTATYNPPNRPGKFQPNSYGLCDLTTSRPELILDHWSGAAVAAEESVDPVGPANDSAVICHNSFFATRTYSAWSLAGVSNTKGVDNPANANLEVCFRYVIHLNPPASFNGQWE